MKPARWGSGSGKLIDLLSRLQSQMLLAALLPVLLVSMLLTWPVVELRRTQLMEQAQLRTIQAGRSSELLIVERLDFAQLLIGLIADRAVLTRMLAANEQGSLAAFVRQSRETTLFDLLTVVDSAGQVLAQDGDGALWQAERRRSASLAVWGDLERGMVAQVSAPLMRDGATIGALVGAFAVGEPFLNGARQRSGLDQSIFVGDALVASSLNGRRTASNRWLLPHGALASGDEATGEREALIGGTPYLVQYQPLHNHKDERIGILEVLLPLGPVKAAQQQTTAAIVLGAALAVGVAMLLSWRLTQRITQAISGLGQAAQRIGAGDFSAPVAVRGATEISSLSRAVDQMREQLRGTHTALAAETARYVNILESSRDAIIVLDADGQVALLNRSTESLLLCKREQSRGAPFSQLVIRHGGEPLLLEQIPLVGSINLAIEVGAGRVHTVEATRAIVRASTHTTRGEQIVVLRDVSDAVALGALKDAFLANVTHEFRTPLSALIASLEILRNEHGDLSPAEQQQMLTAVHIGVHRLDTLVQNLLDSASIQAGYFRVEPEATRLAPLIDEAVDVLRPLVQQRAQIIRVELPPDLPTVLADDRRVVQVLVNLLSNASKFGPRGDTIGVQVTVAQTHIVIAVTDHGPGIPESRQSSLFERFLRPGSETMDAQGAGLGLAIVKAIVERHGGTIYVRAQREHGTTFHVSLQIARVTSAGGAQGQYEHPAR